MPRITISIPDDLKQQLAQTRVKRSLNVSRVCQQALRREVRRLLELPTDLRRMEQLLGRLRAERRRDEERWFAAGSAAARDWVEHEASLQQLEQLGELTLDQRLARLSAEPPAQLEAALEADREEPDYDRTAVLEGWAATIGLMWTVIKRNL